MTAINKSSANPSGRPSVCVATNNGKFGANAPSDAMMGAAHANVTTTRRRPMRSASNAAGRPNRMPMRTMVPATPRPQSPTPKSSPANDTVWVNSVFTNAVNNDAAANKPRTRTCRWSKRSGGAQPGCASRACGARRAIERRISGPNNQ